ncbi:MAG: ATP-binding cassette domain-containing protein [Acidobacteriota bacterium]|nr:ATP-binding cassette domain-containing protein [Acidobacteriota bacterium]
MIEVDRLTKRYGNLKAVDEVSFQVEKGEILGFLGPNGAGKTTTMRILTCFLPATEGTARVAGYDVFENAMEVKRRIGYLPEHPPLYDEMTVDGYLGFVARIKGVAPEDRKRRLQEVKETVRIEGYGKKLIKHLSKGFKQRVGLAQALIHDPEVLILDEPTVGLDPNQIKEVRELIKSLSGNHTIILSTHILPEVSMTCQRVVIISDGKIVAVDTPENLTRQQQGAAHIYMEARGSDVEVQRRLHQIEGVLSVVSRPLGEGEASSYRIETELKQDVRGRIARSIIEGGFELLEFRSLQLSLEEVFTQLTTQEEVRSQ